MSFDVSINLPVYLNPCVRREVCSPPHEKLAHLENSGLQRGTTGTSEEHPQFVLQPFQASLMCSRGSCRSHEGKSEEFRFRRSKDAALATVYS